MARPDRPLHAGRDAGNRPGGSLALSSGKTTACLWKEFNAFQEKPGIWGWLGRYGDGETQTKVKPAFEDVCQQAGCVPRWDSHELCYQFPNGSKAFSYGLKSPDALSRYSKMRGMGVSRIYLDQTEELPADFALELRFRLRQPEFPHQLTFSPNPPNVSHWLAKEFPTTNAIPGRRYYAISIYDNARNLPPGFIDKVLLSCPPEHATHRSKILGLRGMNVTGEPVYKGAFVRALHEVALDYDSRLPLEMGLDFGKHNPCAIFRQVSALGQQRYLGGILGQELYLDDFLDLALRYRSLWFPNPVAVRECCDPAGASNPIGVDMGKALRDKGIRAVYQQDSNSPAIRLSAIERLAASMRRRAADRSEAFAINSNHEQWLVVSENSTTQDPFLADGFEAGYVWDEHMVSVGNKQVRKPKADGWFEHGQVCTQYLELNFGTQPERKREARPQFRGTSMAGEHSWMS